MSKHVITLMLALSVTLPAHAKGAKAPAGKSTETATKVAQTDTAEVLLRAIVGYRLFSDGRVSLLDAQGRTVGQVHVRAESAPERSDTPSLEVSREDVHVFKGVMSEDLGAWGTPDLVGAPSVETPPTASMCSLER